MPHLSNGNFIVSEHGLDTELDREYSSALMFAGRRKPAVRPHIIIKSHCHMRRILLL